ncbi:MAG TPA: RDD family protein [Polyangia bacterium]|jgi:uncharacterized RDD family membrane protein YckC
MLREALCESRYVVRTPEHVEFEFALAGLASRAFALLIDWIIMTLIAGSLVLVGSIISAGFRGLGAFVTFVAMFTVQWGYFVALELWTGGQSIGKKILGLRVIRTDGMRIGFYHSAVRNLFRVIDNLPFFYLLGGTAAALSRVGRRLGDHAAGTIVVRDARRPLPAAVVPPGQRYNSFIQDPRVIRAVRQRLTLRERELLVSLALRREEISLAARLSLYADVGRYLSTRLDLPKPEHFSDEKFVLNLTAVAVEAASAGAPARAAR